MQILHCPAWPKYEVEHIISWEGDIGDPYTYWAADISNKHFAYSIDVSQVLAHCTSSFWW